MTKSREQLVGECANRLTSVTLHNTAEEAIYGFLVGAIYGLRRAFELGYSDRTGEALPTDYDRELVRVAQTLVSSSTVSEHAWLAGFYFNSAIQRLGPVCERLGKYATEQKDLIPSVRREVNRLKHDVSGLLNGRRVNPDQAVNAVIMLTTAVSTLFSES